MQYRFIYYAALPVLWPPCPSDVQYRNESSACGKGRSLFPFENRSRWDRYLGMTAAMTQVPVPTATITQPSWIIGYNPSNIGIPSINTATRVVTFYTSKGVVGSVNWNSFNKVINKLR